MESKKLNKNVLTLLRTLLPACTRNAIRFSFGEDGAATAFRNTRFGGEPDAPEDFAWPFFAAESSFDEEIKPRPLAFFAQLDCAELHPYDKDGLLPASGLLSFFYEMESGRWGFDPDDAGCGRVFYFPDSAALQKAAFPAALREEFRFPSVSLCAARADELPAPEEFALPPGEENRIAARYDEEYFSLWEQSDKEACRAKLLGWADIIQDSIAEECAQVTNKGEPSDWILLFQFSSIYDRKDCEISLGDNGNLYFYILKQDLQQRRFDRVWTVLQCY